jgi:hypothetical protein
MVLLLGCANGGKGQYCCTNGANNPGCDISKPTVTTTTRRTTTTTTRPPTTTKFRVYIKRKNGF